MATGTILLPIPGGYPPAGVNTNSYAAPVIKVNSSGSATTNAPTLSYYGYLFYAANDYCWLWDIPLPSDYASGGTVKLNYANYDATSTATCVWKAAAAPAVPGTTDRDTLVFNTVATTSSTPNATIGVPVAVSIGPLTMTNAAANRPVILFVGRDSDHASDTNIGSMIVTEALFEYTTT